MDIKPAAIRNAGFWIRALAAWVDFLLIYFFLKADVGCPPLFLGFLEHVMARRGYTPAGFSIKNSPFEYLRDSCSEYFNVYPTIVYGDLVEGLIFLKPFKDLQHCTWTKGYISDKMFMQYKPLYEVIAKRRFANSGDVNRYFMESYLR